ncbi:hypothetical protein NHQ30_003678 [Ciborinia camelliae]|nr:hypothetical protein NHQ30_003678 [Ciborinia camelliae]
MAASITQNPASKPESKSAKKKKAKIEAVEVQKSVAPPAATEKAPSNSAEESSNGDGAYESPYIKELYKNIRNVNKKITNASKVDNVLAENTGKTLDELVATRKINADQKAQILKKPSLQASLAQLEEQIAQYKKFDQEYKTKIQVEKAEFEKTFNERASRELEEKVNAAKELVAKEKAEEQEHNLLLITKFLCLAALRRSPENDPNLEENKGIEGLLTQVYSGDEAAVAAMTKIIQGSDEACFSVNNEELTTTFADIKAIALALPTTSVVTESDEPAAEETIQPEVAEYLVQSDPTIANAGLTEIDDPVTSALTNGHQEPSFEEAHGIPQNSAFGEAGNAAAEANWDNNNELSTSQEWVEVPREAAETETGVAATPAAAANTQSWADEQPDSPGSKTPTPPVSSNDGFHEVSRRGRGEYRGRGGRGRGGFRNDGQFRGRGRGGPRGAPRAPRGDSS